MFKALLAVRMRALLHSFQFAKAGRRISPVKKAGIGLLFLYVVGCFVFLFAMEWDMLCSPLHAAGLDWFYFTMTIITAFALMVIGSVFSTMTQLYEAKDNELLLSMPVPPSMILTSRMAMLLVMNLFFELLVLAPAAVVYVKYVGFTAAGFLAFAVIFLCLPLLALAVSAVVGSLLAAIAGRVRKKSLFTMLFSLGFLALYFYAFSNMNQYLQTLIANSGAIAQRLSGISPLYWLGNAPAQGDLLQLLFAVLCMAVPFALVYWVLQKTFLRLITTKRGTAKVQYREKKEVCRSAKQAMVRKELRGFFASPVYMMNGGLGVIFMLAGAVMLIVKAETLTNLLASLGMLTSDIGVAAALILCLLHSTSIISAASVSLEGKQIWIPMTMPVKSSGILYSKVIAHLMIVLPPSLLASVTAAIVLKLSLPVAVLVVVVPALMGCFCALAGVIINLKLPKLDWISQAQAVKQGASTLLAMLVTAAAVLIPGVLLFAVGGSVDSLVFLAAYAAGLLLLCAGMLRWLKTRGSRCWEALLS